MPDASGSTASAAHPFVGLRPFTFEDAAFFFGREPQIEALLRLVRTGTLVSVVGSSGSGKSSLLRAGVLPRLAAQSPPWDWVEMRPGESPVRNLAEALARPNRTAGLDAADPLAEARADRIELVLQQSSFGIQQSLSLLKGRDGRRLLILVDQFEEVFRFADLRAQRNRSARQAAEQRDEATFFIQLLLTAAASDDLPACIMTTMRSDFIGECARFHGLSEAVTRTQYLVPALARDQRATAIRDPVEVAGGRTEPALVQRLLNDSNEDADQLPVMQHAIMRCWQHATRPEATARPPTIALENYAAIGKLEGALTQHGDELLAILAARPGPSDTVPTLASVAKRVFQSLTEVDSQGRAIRRPQTLADLVAVIAPDDDPGSRAAAEQAVRDVVDHFANRACSFLSAPVGPQLEPGTIVDIGHEALIRRWERFGGLDQDSWIREEQMDAETYGQLLLYAGDNSLVPKARLHGFEEWWTTRAPTRAWAQRYTRGGEDRLGEVLDTLRRSRRQVARDRRVKQAGMVFAAALVAAAALLWVREQRVQRDRLAQEAARERTIAAERAIKQAQLIAVEGVDALRVATPYQALLLAAYGLMPSAERPVVRENVALAYEALDRMRERSVFNVASCVAPTLAFTPDGTLMSFSGRMLRFWDPLRGVADPTRDIPGPPDLSWVSSLSVDPSGNFVLVSGEGRVFLVDRTARSASPLDPARKLGSGLFSPDGTLIVTFGREASPKLWSFGPSPAADAPMQATLLMDFATYQGAQLRDSQAAAVSPDSRSFAVGSQRSGAVHVFVVDGIRLSRVLPLPTTPGATAEELAAQHGVVSLTFDPSDPNRVLATYQNAAPRLWDIASGQSRTLDLAPGGFSRTAFSPDGRLLAVAAFDERVRVWDLAPLRGQPIEDGAALPPAFVVRGSDGPFFSVAFDAGHRLMTGSTRGTAWFWDAEPALSRGLSTAPTAAPPATPAPTALRIENGIVYVRSTVPGVPEGPLLVPPGAATAAASAAAPASAPASTAVSSDGAWGVVVPDYGPLLLYDLRDPTGPVAALGTAAAEWKGASFATGPDRVIGLDRSGTPHAWRYFTDRADLARFIDDSLPMVDGRPAQLRAEMRQKLNGDFWSVLTALKAGLSDTACSATSRPGAPGAQARNTP